MKYYLVVLEWRDGFKSHSVVMGNRLEGEKKHIAKLDYVVNSSFHEIEKHEYEKFWTGEFKPQGLSKASKRTPKSEPKPKGPQFSSLDTFFTNTEKPNGRPRKTRNNRQ